MALSYQIISIRVLPITTITIIIIISMQMIAVPTPYIIPKARESVMVLELATFGNPMKEQLLKNNNKTTRSGTRLGFGKYADLTYKDMLWDHYESYVTKNFGRYVYSDCQNQNVMAAHVQQKLEFVPVDAPKVSTKERQAFMEWLQTPDAGYTFEGIEVKICCVIL